MCYERLMSAAASGSRYAVRKAGFRVVSTDDRFYWEIPAPALSDKLISRGIACGAGKKAKNKNASTMAGH